MPNQKNITNIPSSRVDFIDQRTGLMSREWYRFFLNLFNLTGAGNNPTSLDDLQVGPPSGGGESTFGTVTSVNVSGGTTGLTTSGGPITSAGTITLGGVLNVANGGTGSSTAGGAPFALKGANADITSMSGITGAISSPDYIQFDTAYATTLGVGQLGWDGNNTLGIGMYGGHVIQKIGEDFFYYVKASSAITKGQLCMFTGSVGASAVAKAAPSSGITSGQLIMGIAAEDIALNAFGLVQVFGTLKNVNTSAFADDDILYYDSAVAGGLTTTFPSSGPIVTCAAVLNGGSSGGGTLLVRITVTQRISAGSGVSVTQNGTGTTISNTSPSSGGTVTSVAATAGTGISVTGSPITTSGTLNITNTAPDQTVVMTSGTGISVTGTYPNFTITNTSPSSGGTVTSVTGTSPVVSSGGTTPAISLASGYGDTQNPYASKTANYVLAAPNGSAGAPTFRALVAADVPALSYVSSIAVTAPITSTGGLTPTIGITQASGSTNGYLSSTDWTTFNNKQAAGTYVTSIAVASSNGLAGTSSGGATPTLTLSTSITGMLKGNGTAISAGTAGSDYSAGTSSLATGILKSTTTTGALSIAVAADFPTLNQNTTGTASNVTGTVAIANGGTGQTTASAAFNALSPVTSTGDLIVGNGTNSSTRLPIGTNGYVLTSNGTTATWAASTGGVTSFSAGTTGLTPNTATTGAVTLAGTLGIANGGTGQTSFTNNYIHYGSFSTSASLQFDGTTMRVGASALLGGTTNPIVGVTGTANQYIQQYIYNSNSGTSASADFVAYADNSTDSHGWADVGFTSSTYADATYTVTGKNEAYIFGSAPSGAGATGNLVYATDSTGSANAHQFYVGGFNQAKGAWKAQIDSTGLKATQVNATNGLIVNSMTVSANYTIATGDNAMSVGPMTVAAGVAVTVSSGSRWVVI